eukprot:TRINITY_DN3885_c0_g3_i2.p1 TRINITY_DN3885_c0_g3~~TRINITY_DN3885_c0_g3_i2.p1  ORF type:complete len:111 (-),score=20.04 TRINITY_DN3885_c0_g3_i2:47-379(-)
MTTNVRKALVLQHLLLAHGMGSSGSDADFFSATACYAGHLYLTCLELVLAVNTFCALPLAETPLAHLFDGQLFHLKFYQFENDVPILDICEGKKDMTRLFAQCKSLYKDY